MSETILERIAATTRADLAERRAQTPLEELYRLAADAPAPRPFARSLRPEPGAPARLIAEVKRASPSRGMIAVDFDPVAQAKAYVAGGAAAISVLTEPRFFQGSLDHLRVVRDTVNVPVLRKDFLLDPYQVYEARAAGADSVLLICALLDDATLRELLGLAGTLGMEPLVEAHDAMEVGRALSAGARVIGVNSRDLRTFAVDTDVVRHLRPLVPGDRICVAESGITDATGAARARAFGADALLAGEALMRAADPAAKARELAAAPGGGPIREFYAAACRPLVKICGLRTAVQVEVVDDLGADAFGMVFAPSTRRLSLDQARALMDATFRGEGPRATGVFVNETVTDVTRIAGMLQLEAVQLSGDETPEQCAEVAARAGVPAVKALRLRVPADLAQLDAYALAGVVPLLDTPARTGVYGGTGQTGDWSLAREAARRWPVILSGGLTPENVAEAIRVVQPRGVDVSSGVETGGVKDLEKMRAFVRAARHVETVDGTVDGTLETSAHP